MYDVWRRPRIRAASVIRRGGQTALVWCVWLAILASLSACRRDKPSHPHLQLIVSSAPEALDTRFTSSAVAQRIGHLVFAPLLQVGEDLAAAPYLAAAYELVDETTYRVELDPRAHFSDGSAVTADDVIYTFSALGDKDVRSVHAAKFKTLKEVRHVDDNIVEFVLDKPNPAFPLELCAIGIVSRRHCENRTSKCRDKPLGAGPFAVSRLDLSAERLSLVANRHWHRGRVELAGIDIRVVRDQTTRLLEMLDGKADLSVGELAPDLIDILEREPRIHHVTERGLGYSYIAMNLRPPFDDDDDEVRRTKTALGSPLVRQAMALALDVDRVIATKLRGAAQRATGMLPPGHWASAKALKPDGYDPKRAEALLDQAGYARREDGTRFHLEWRTTTDRLRRSLAIIFAHQLRQVGIDVEVKVGEWATLYQDIKRGAFEVFSAKWTPVVEPDLMHWVFHSENIPGPGHAGGNRGAYKNADVDKALEFGRSTSKRDIRARYYAQAETTLAEQRPYIPLWFEDEIAVMSERVRGFRASRTGALSSLATTRLIEDGR